MLRDAAWCCVLMDDVALMLVIVQEEIVYLCIQEYPFRKSCSMFMIEQHA